MLFFANTIKAYLERQMLLVQPLEAFFLAISRKKNVQVWYNAVTKSDIGMNSHVIIEAYQ